jgi:aspartate aminotransferase
MMPVYETTLVASSFSKDLGLAGERIGYLAIHPKFPDFAAVWEGLCFCLRTLGFVNAPALMQRAVAGVLDATVDVEAYRRNRELLCDGLEKIGYRLRRPDGSFFVFPEAPGGDDLAFLQRLLRERVVAVPGVGFDAPGYFRVSFAAPPEAITAALPAFERAFKS